MSVHAIGKIDAFAARNTDLFLDTETGKVYYVVFGTQIGVIDETGEVEKLVRKFHREQKSAPVPAVTGGSDDNR